MSALQDLIVALQELHELKPDAQKEEKEKKLIARLDKNLIQIKAEKEARANYQVSENKATKETKESKDTGPNLDLIKQMLSFVETLPTTIFYQDDVESSKSDLIEVLQDAAGITPTPDTTDGTFWVALSKAIIFTKDTEDLLSQSNSDLHQALNQISKLDDYTYGFHLAIELTKPNVFRLIASKLGLDFTDWKPVVACIRKRDLIGVFTHILALYDAIKTESHLNLVKAWLKSFSSNPDASEVLILLIQKSTRKTFFDHLQLISVFNDAQIDMPRLNYCPVGTKKNILELLIDKYRELQETKEVDTQTKFPTLKEVLQQFLAVEFFEKEIRALVRKYSTSQTPPLYIKYINMNLDLISQETKDVKQVMHGSPVSQPKQNIGDQNNSSVTASSTATVTPSSITIVPQGPG